MHSIGRTGRVGNSGVAISFYNDKDNSQIASKLVKLLAEAEQSIPDFLSHYNDGTSFANETAEKDTRHVSIRRAYLMCVYSIRLLISLYFHFELG